MKQVGVAVAVALVAVASSADVKYFCKAPGSPGIPENPDYLSWETAGTNIYDAVYIANGQFSDSTQRTLYVMSGTYSITNEIAINNSQFEMRSSKGPSAQEEIDPEGTILCGAYPFYTNRIVSIKSDSFSPRFCVFRGFTVTNGWVSGKGGGIYVKGARDGRTCVADCIVAGNFAYCGAGGGIAFEPDTAGSGFITNCFVFGNVTSNLFQNGQNNGTTSGAVSIGSTGSAGMSTVSRTTGFRVFDTVISNNYSCGNAIRSSGLWCKQNSVWIENCRIVNNRGVGMSGGNTAYSPAVYLSGGSFLIGCRVEGNSAANSSSAAGIHAMAACTISNCVVYGNTGHSAVHGEAYESKYGNIPVSVVNCTISDNGGQGTRLVKMGKGMVLRNSLLLNATGFVAVNQIAALTLDTENVVENCTLAGNSKAVYCTSTAEHALVNCAFYDNGRNLHQSGGGTLGISFTNCYFSVKESYVKERPCVDCVFDADPRFSDYANGDLTLLRKSPLRDAGLSLGWMAGAVDLAGNPRLVDSTGRPSPSATPDIGCYECNMRAPGISVSVW